MLNQGTHNRSIVKSGLFAILATLAAGTSNFALSDQLTMPAHVSSSTHFPRRGITKDQVLAKFGEPQSKHGPNGEPPIYYWEYKDFTVYFESNHVLHSVDKNQRLKK